MIHSQSPTYDKPVGGNFIARRQKYDVAANDLRDGELHYPPSAAHAAKIIFVFLIELGERTLTTVFRQRGDKGGEKDRHRDTHRLHPVRRAEYKENIEKERGNEDLNDRVVQILYEMRPKACAFWRGHGVASVDAAGFYDLLLRKPCACGSFI